MGALNVPLHEDSTRLGPLGLNHKVGNLNIADIAGLADLKHGLGVGLVLEVGVATSHQHGPNFTDNLDVARDADSVGNDVCTMREEGDLVLGKVVKSLLNRSGIVALTVTHRTGSLDRYKPGSRDVKVLGLAASEHLARVVEKGGRLARPRPGSLNSLALGTSVGAALNPRLNHLVSLKDGGPGSTILHCSGNVGGEVDVVDDQGAVGAGLAWVVEGRDANWRVGKGRVLNNDGADGLRITTGCKVDSNATVFDHEAMVVPDPVPDLVDGGLAVV